MSIRVVVVEILELVLDTDVLVLLVLVVNDTVVLIDVDVLEKLVEVD